MVHGSVVREQDRISNVEGSNPMSATAKKTNPKLVVSFINKLLGIKQISQSQSHPY
jgi:hypothetical protein